jgi:putative ABC transport system permease protein
MISTFTELIPTGLLQGLVLGILVLGVMIPFKVLDFPDLTSEGSYPVGGVITAVLLVNSMHPIASLIIGATAAGLIGIGTALIHLRYKVNTLLAGIIVSKMVYSVNLRLMGKPTIALFNYDTLFDDLSSGAMSQSIIVFILNILIVSAIYLFLRSEKGLSLRAVGLNRVFAMKQGINLQRNIIFGLFLGNFLAGLSGGLIVLIQNYVDISMGVGIVIHALAAMMIGEKIVGHDTIFKMIISPLIGALIYQQIHSLAISAGLAPTDLKFITGVIVLFIISLGGKERVV